MRIRFRKLVPQDIYEVQRHMPFAASQNQTGIVAYDDNTSEYAAIFIAQEWTATAAFVHQVIMKPMVIRHGWFEEIANYMFTHAARIKLFGMAAETNWKALNVMEKLGFKEKARLEDGYDMGVDFVLMELKREECPYWIEPELAEVANG